MNCPFCERPLNLSDRSISNGPISLRTFICREQSCWVDGEFPRYYGMIDKDGRIVTQEYALGKFYVKVYEHGSFIYRVVSYMLEDEVKVPRALWLNPINTDETLDKLKMLVMFS